MWKAAKLPRIAACRTEIVLISYRYRRKLSPTCLRLALDWLLLLSMSALVFCLPCSLDLEARPVMSECIPGLGQALGHLATSRRVLHDLRPLSRRPHL